MRATDFAAKMEALTASMPLIRDFFSCSYAAKQHLLLFSASQAWRMVVPGTILRCCAHPDDDEGPPELIERERHGCVRPVKRSANSDPLHVFAK